MRPTEYTGEIGNVDPEIIAIMARRLAEESANKLGRDAFKAGKKCIPAHDPAMMNMLEGMKVGQEAVNLLKAWRRGWDLENMTSDLENLAN